MQAIKSVKQPFQPSMEIATLMETFRQMVNECIRTGIKENKTSLKSLSLVCYPKLKKYKIISYYKLCAISRASGILKNYRNLVKQGRRVKEPYCLKPMLTTCYGFKIRDGYLLLPQSKHKQAKIPLNTYVTNTLSDPSLVVRSVTLSAATLSISVEKQSDVIECTGMLGIDRNLDNITVVDTDGNCIRYDLSKATEIRAHCKQVRNKFVRNDVRVRKIIHGKYGKLEKDRVAWILNNTSKKIVAHAKQNRMAIAMEDIKGIRKLYRKGNGQGKKYRGKMNSWSYYELQRQIEYKAQWEGIPVIYVEAHGTSAKCSRCGDKMFPEENRMLRCARCKLSIDRDVNAARNILARGLRFKPVGLSGEAMVKEPSQEVILRVDESQLTFHQRKGEMGQDPSS